MRHVEASCCFKAGFPKLRSNDFGGVISSVWAVEKICALCSVGASPGEHKWDYTKCSCKTRRRISLAYAVPHLLIPSTKKVLSLANTSTSNPLLQQPFRRHKIIMEHSICLHKRHLGSQFGKHFFYQNRRFLRSPKLKRLRSRQ